MTERPTKGKTPLVIYELDGVTLKCFIATPGKDCPTEFTAIEGCLRTLSQRWSARLPAPATSHTPFRRPHPGRTADPQRPRASPASPWPETFAQNPAGWYNDGNPRAILNALLYSIPG